MVVVVSCTHSVQTHNSHQYDQQQCYLAWSDLLRLIRLVSDNYAVLSDSLLMIPPQRLLADTDMAVAGMQRKHILNADDH